MIFWSRTQSQAEGQFDEFAQRFAEVPGKVRPANDQPGLWPAALWINLLQLPFPRPAEFWVSRSGNQRIGANISLTQPDVGFIGFFETKTDPSELSIAHDLLTQAESFLRSQGAKKIYGPLNYNTWFPYRFGLPHTDHLRFTWEPAQPEPYLQLWLKAGYQICETYQSVGLHGLTEYALKTEGSYRQALSRGYQFRMFDVAHLESKEIPALYQLSMAGFQENFLFEPLDLQGFSQIYVPAMKKADLSYSFFALDPHGKEVGFFYGFADQGYLVLKTTAIHPDHRGQGLSNALTYLQTNVAIQNGLKGFITALVRKGAQSESYKKKAEALWTHDYVLLEKQSP